MIPKGHLDRIFAMARREGWRLVYRQDEQLLVRFQRGGHRLDVWWTTMTVGSYLEHPKQGKTAMFRRRCSYETLAKLFRNPRQHTGKGYKTRK